MSTQRVARSKTQSKVKKNWAETRNGLPPTLTEEDRKELREDLYRFAKEKLDVDDRRASYLADTYSVVSTS